jgi:hypothetical protein
MLTHTNLHAASRRHKPSMVKKSVFDTSSIYFLLAKEFLCEAAFAASS